MRIYGYFILPDASVCRLRPLLDHGCGVVAATSKWAAEMQMSYLDASDIHADIRTDGHRILFVRRGVLTTLGMNNRLFLGMDTTYRTEIIEVGSAGLASAITWRLRGFKSRYDGPVVYIKKSGRIHFDRIKKSIIETLVGFPEGQVRLVDNLTKDRNALFTLNGVRIDQ
ncbi:hypothetical protein [Geothrix fermentans]|uniref:hypothetical protein n=1 Tax=Geothrix fermentans TaxID=44676 RepID=UPI00047C2BCD|nr:hypothetical protein [Geothrix fermentans]